MKRTQRNKSDSKKTVAHVLTMGAGKKEGRYCFTMIRPTTLDSGDNYNTCIREPFSSFISLSKRTRTTQLIRRGREKREERREKREERKEKRRKGT